MSNAHSAEQELNEILASSLVDVCPESNANVPPSGALRRAALPVASTHHSTLLQQLRAAPGRAVDMPDLTIDGSSAVSRFHFAMSKAFKGECKEAVVMPPEELRALCRRHVERQISRKALRDQEAAEQSDRNLLRSWAAAPEGKADG